MAILLVVLLVSPGCVTRKLFIRSEPPGAEVLLDGEVVGTTPYEQEFLSYGVRRVELRLPGFQREVQAIDVERPWWQYFPMSLVTDVLVPWHIQDDHHFMLPLQTYQAVNGRDEAAAKAHAAYEQLKAMRGKDVGFAGEADTEADTEGDPDEDN